jgi:ribosome-associated protein
LSLSPDTQKTLRLVHAAAERKLAKDPIALDVHDLSSITDALYVCHADSTRSVDAIVDAVLKALEAERGKRPHVEGRAASQWVLIDLGDVMVHVFLKERREYYNLERLWHDAPQVTLEAA